MLNNFKFTHLLSGRVRKYQEHTKYEDTKNHFPLPTSNLRDAIQDLRLLWRLLVLQTAHCHPSSVQGWILGPELAPSHPKHHKELAGDFQGQH